MAVIGLRARLSTDAARDAASIIWMENNRLLRQKALDDLIEFGNRWIVLDSEHVPHL